MLSNNLLNPAQLSTSISYRFGHLNRLEPELGILFRRLHMNMGRLIPFITIEEKPMPIDS